jgi:isocitrate/isopropylmalate dehydrogenase
LAIEWQEDLPSGVRGHELHGTTCPQSTWDALAKLDGWVLGPHGHDVYPKNDPTWFNPPMRKRHEMYANVKPVRSYPNIPSLHKNVDIVFLRETTEGMQAGGVVVAGSGEFRPNNDISIGMRVITRKGANRAARSIRDRATAAEEGDLGAQGIGLQAVLRHVRRGVPRGGEGFSGRAARRGVGGRFRHEAGDETAAVRRGSHHQPVR